MLLFIDTSDYHHTRFALVDERSVLAQTVLDVPYHESYTTLGHIDTLLKQYHEQPERIIVATGPGAFTGVRVGLALAQGLGLAWGVPVVGVANVDIPDDLTKLWEIKTGDSQIQYAELNK